MTSLTTALAILASLESPISLTVDDDLAFPNGTLDYYGYVTVDSVPGCGSEANRGYELLKSNRYREAKKVFLDLKTKGNGVFAFVGYVQSIRGTGELGGFVKKLTPEIMRLWHKKDEGSVMRSLEYLYACRVEVDVAVRERRLPLTSKVDGHSAGDAFALAYEQLQARQFSSRPNVAVWLGIRASCESLDIARSAYVSAIARDPGFTVLRMNLVELY